MIFLRNLLKTDSVGKSTLMLSASGYLSSAIGFLFWALAANLSDSRILGSTLAITAFIPLMVTFGNFGGSDAVLRFFESSKRSFDFLKQIFFRSLTISLIFLAGFLVFWFADKSLPEVRIETFGTFALIVLASMTSGISSAALVSTHKEKWIATNALLSGILKLLLLLALSMSGLTIAGVLSAICVASLLEASLNCFRVIKLSIPEESKFRSPSLIGYSLANWVASTFSVASGALIPLTVLSLYGPESVSRTSIPLMILAAMSLPTSALARSYLSFSVKSEINEKIIFRKSIRVAYVVSISLSVSLYFLGGHLLEIFGQDIAQKSTYFLQWFSLCSPLMVANYFFDAKLNFLAKKRLYTALNVLGSSSVILACFGALHWSLAFLPLGYALGQVSYSIMGIACISIAKKGR